MLAEGGQEGSEDEREHDYVNFEAELRDVEKSLSVRSQRKAIRQELTDPYNRLHSIAEDAKYVEKVANAFPTFAVVPNLRCGAWYVDPQGPQTVQQGVYFQSKDGHIGQWAFHLRRPNLGLLTILQKHEGAIIVDSTRRGKRFPDALAKALPIWCSVINRAISHRYSLGWSAEVLDVITPQESVGPSEKDQIRIRLQGWADSLAASSYALPRFVRPIVPVHLNPDADLNEMHKLVRQLQPCHPVICLSASRCTSGGSAERSGIYNYVPGSGDDHEGWAPAGFTPDLFWRHKAEILDAGRTGLSRVLADLIVKQKDGSESEQARAGKIYRIGQTRIWLALPMSTPVTSDVSGALQVHFAADIEANLSAISVPSQPKKHLSVFEQVIAPVIPEAAKALAEGKGVVVHIDDDEPNTHDLGVGMTVTLLALFYGNDGILHTARFQTTKATVIKRLEWIVASVDKRINPSRGILKRINHYLLTAT